jgi:hypothetical protein
MANSVNPLLFSVDAAVGESLLSIVCRATARNHETSTRAVLALIDGPFDNFALHERSDLVPALAHLVGVPEAELTSRLYGPSLERGPGLDEERNFFGTYLPAYWLTEAKRIAPGAMAEAPYHRALWDLAIFEVCPDSGEPLIETCPGCQRGLNWTTSMISACNFCGVDLARSGRITAATAVDTDLAGVRFIADLLAPWRGGSVAAMSQLPQALRMLSTVELVRLMLLLPDMISDEASGARRRMQRQRRRPVELAASLKLLQGWPASLHEMLARQAGLTPFSGRFGIQHHFGPRFVGLLREYDVEADRFDRAGVSLSAYEILLQEAARYFACRPHIPLRRGTLLAERVNLLTEVEDHRQVASISDVTAMTGWGLPRVRRLAMIWPEAVIHWDGQGSGAPMLLDACRVKEIVSTVEASLSVPEAAKLLGVPQPVCRELIEIGLLRCLEERFAKLHGASGSEMLLNGDTVKQLLLDLEAGAARGCPERPLTFRAVHSSMAIFGLGGADILKLMLDGHLRYHRVPALRSHGAIKLPFHFDAKSLEKLSAKRRATMPMAIKAAATELQWNQQTVLSMLRCGEMQMISQKGRHGATLIAREEVARARRDYRSTAEVGLRLLAKPTLPQLRMLAAELRRRGLKPVVGDGGAAHRDGQLIWRAHEITLFRVGLKAWARDIEAGRKGAQPGEAEAAT